jgi:hypothetical protein
MSKLIRFQPLTALAVTGLFASVVATGCSDTINDIQSAACCSEFVVGADLSGVDFEIEGELEGQFKALAQASSDLSAVASGALTDVAIACENIARDMGASAEDIDKANAKEDAARVADLCTLATAQIDATFGAKAEVKGTLKVDFQPPACSASIDAQASCEGSCSVEGKCDAMAELPKCEGGKLTVECSGSCDVSAESPEISCSGGCTGQCSGSCTAEAGATVDCEGTCEGTCTVDGTANSGSGVQADGTCKGKCEGKCTASAGAKVDCAGTCEGTCDAKCEARPGGVKMKCDGKCEGEFEAPKCEGGKAELNCDVDADCKANCSASASAKAECTPPELSIVYDFSASASAEAQAKIDVGLASLKANLPNLIVVVKARGAAFTAGIEASIKAGGKVVAEPGELSAKAVGCLLPVTAALAKASENFGASLSASVKVAGAAGIK